MPQPDGLERSSSHTTLFVMLIVTAVLLPIVLLYTAWAFKVMWGRVTTERSPTAIITDAKERRPMWYFTWILGLGLACTFAILNAMWHELSLSDSGDTGSSDEAF
jgi:cyd operon protein YbgT